MHVLHHHHHPHQLLLCWKRRFTDHFRFFLDFWIKVPNTTKGFSHTTYTKRQQHHHEKSKQSSSSSSPTYNSYVVSILLYIVLRATIHVVAISEERICPDNTIITGYTCDRNVWGFVFSSLVLPLSSAVSQSHRFQMTVFPFFLTDIMFEIQPIPFLIVLHHAVCLVGHFMIWNTNRAVVLEYCKILVSFEFGSGLTNLYDWLRRFDIDKLDCACCILYRTWQRYISPRDLEYECGRYGTSTISFLDNQYW